MIDLDMVDPTGRLDVAVYRFLGLIAQSLEPRYGLDGAWNVIKPHAGALINQYLDGVEVPTEAELVMKLMLLGGKSKAQTEG